VIAELEGEVDLEASHPQVAPPPEVPAGIPVDVVHEDEESRAE
jgi:hypothetical protein